MRGASIGLVLPRSEITKWTYGHGFHILSSNSFLRRAVPENKCISNLCALFFQRTPLQHCFPALYKSPYEDIPKYVYGTTMESMEIDANQMLQQAEEDSDVEDFYFDDIAAKELREFVKQWNAKYAKSYYSWNDKVVIMLPPEYQKERVND